MKAITEAFVDMAYAEEAMQLCRLIIAGQQHFPELGELVYRFGLMPLLRHLPSYPA